MNQLMHVITFPQVSIGGLLASLTGPMAILGRLVYGTGMRLMEALRLRVKDVDFDRREIVVREGKGGKDRRVMLPVSLVVPLQLQLDHARAIWESDAATGRAVVSPLDRADRAA